MTKHDDLGGFEPPKRRLRSTTATATLCDLMELDVSIYEPSLVVIRDEHGDELFRAELSPASCVLVRDPVACG